MLQSTTAASCLVWRLCPQNALPSSDVYTGTGTPHHVTMSSVQSPPYLYGSEAQPRVPVGSPGARCQAADVPVKRHGSQQESLATEGAARGVKVGVHVEELQVIEQEEGLWVVMHEQGWW